MKTASPHALEWILHRNKTMFQEQNKFRTARLAASFDWPQDIVGKLQEYDPDERKITSDRASKDHVQMVFTDTGYLLEMGTSDTEETTGRKHPTLFVCVPEYCDPATLQIRQEYPWNVLQHGNRAQKSSSSVVVFGDGEMEDLPGTYDMCERIVRDTKTTVYLFVPLARVRYSNVAWRKAEKKNARIGSPRRRFDTPAEVMKAYAFDTVSVDGSPAAIQNPDHVRLCIGANVDHLDNNTNGTIRDEEKYESKGPAGARGRFLRIRVQSLPFQESLDEDGVEEEDKRLKKILSDATVVAGGTITVCPPPCDGKVRIESYNPLLEHLRHQFAALEAGDESKGSALTFCVERPIREVTPPAIHVWESQSAPIASSIASLFLESPTPFTEDDDSFTERGSEYRRTRLFVSELQQDIHIFADRALVKRCVGDVLRKSEASVGPTVVIVNAPYGGWCLEHGLHSSKKFASANDDAKEKEEVNQADSPNVFTIDAEAIGRILSSSASDVLREALALVLEASSYSSASVPARDESKRSDLSYYVEENGLHEVVVPKRKRRRLPPRIYDVKLTVVPAEFTKRAALDKRLAGEEEKDEALATKVSSDSVLAASLLRSARLRRTRRRGLWRVKKNVPLTSKEYGRDLAHVELVCEDSSDGGIPYKPGQVLKVRPTNSSERVIAFLLKMKWSGDDLIRVVEDSLSSPWSRLTTVQDHATCHLELFACPKSLFCSKLSGLVRASDDARAEFARRQLLFLAENQDMMEAQGLTYAAVLTTYASVLCDAIPSYAALVSSRLVPEMAERSYSIASCADIVGKNQVDLIVVRETWTTCDGILRGGLCSSFICELASNTLVRAQVDESTSLAVDDKSKDIVMIGFGTGIAPLRAFCQWYYACRRRGEKTGNIILYFGARTSSNENMYGFELFLLRQLTQTGGNGPIVRLRQAFSRDDPKKKVYVQHLMEEDKTMIKDFLGPERKGLLMLCGPVRPVDGACDVVSDLCGISTEALASEGRLLVESY